MNDLYLTDEDIWGKEPSDVEKSLIDENDKLKKKLIDSENTIEQIKAIVKEAIEVNLKKTNREYNVPVIKSYRKALLVLREIEKELDDYYGKLTS